MEFSWRLSLDVAEPPEPSDISVAEQQVAACPAHLWQLILEEDADVDLSCELCPAGVDDLYPDGVDMIYFYADGIRVEAGSHNLPDEDTPIVIPVSAHVLATRDYWGEYDVEMIIEARGAHDEAESPISHSS